ncbi:hypothetical protein Tco_1394303 [Tanacetum coccineum]
MVWGKEGENSREGEGNGIGRKGGNWGKGRIGKGEGGEVECEGEVRDGNIGKKKGGQVVMNEPGWREGMVEVEGGGDVEEGMEYGRMVGGGETEKGDDRIDEVKSSGDVRRRRRELEKKRGKSCAKAWDAERRGGREEGRDDGSGAGGVEADEETGNETEGEVRENERRLDDASERKDRGRKGWEGTAGKGMGGMRREGEGGTERIGRQGEWGNRSERSGGAGGGGYMVRKRVEGVDRGRPGNEEAGSEGMKSGGQSKGMRWGGVGGGNTRRGIEERNGRRRNEWKHGDERARENGSLDLGATTQYLEQMGCEGGPQGEEFRKQRKLLNGSARGKGEGWEEREIRGDGKRSLWKNYLERGREWAWGLGGRKAWSLGEGREGVKDCGKEGVGERGDEEAGRWMGVLGRLEGDEGCVKSWRWKVGGQGMRGEESGGKKIRRTQGRRRRNERGGSVRIEGRLGGDKETKRGYWAKADEGGGGEVGRDCRVGGWCGWTEDPERGLLKGKKAGEGEEVN